MDYPPFDFAVGGEPQGYSVELVELIADRIGLEIEFVNGYTWDELWEKFERKELDIVHPVYRNEYRTQFGLFSKQLYSGRTVFVTRSEQQEIRNIRDLDGMIVAAPKGWATTNYLQKNHPDIELLITNNTEESLGAVSQSKADVTFEIDAVANYLLGKGMHTDLRLNGWFREFDDNHLNNFFVLTRKDWPILHQLILKAQDSITPGEMQELQNKWFPPVTRASSSIEKHITMSAAEKAYLRKKGKIRMCSAPGWPPIEWIDKNGQHQGISADFIGLIAERIRHDIQLTPTKTWSETIEHAKNRQCDFVSAITESPERGQYLNFSNVYQQLDVVIATRKEQIYIQDIEALSGKKIGVVANSIYESLLKRNYPDIDLVPVDDMMRGLHMVETGQLIGFVDNMISLAYAIQQNALLALKISGRVGEPIKLRIGVRNDEPQLLDILGRALNSISAKQREAFASKWISVKVEQPFDYRLFWQGLAAVLAVLMVIVYWNRKLASFNQGISQANEMLAETQRIAGLGSWEFDVVSQKIAWSDEVFRIAGMEVSEHPPSFEEYLEKVHPDDRDKLHSNIEKALQGESYEVELRHLLPDDSYNYTLTRAKPVLRDGEVIKVQGSVLDLTRLRKTELSLKDEVKQRLAYEDSLKEEISERQRVEDALRQSEHQLQLITDNTPAYIAYVDADTLEYLFVNRMFINAYKRPREEIVGQHVKEIIGQENYEFALPYIREAIEGKSISYVNEFPLDEGSRWINVHYEPDFDDDGKVRALFVLSHDITDRKQIEQDLSKAKEDAEQANQYKSEFLANMSHEIRTPLNAVLGFSELLETTEIDKTQKNYLKSIRSGGKSLLSLINDILDLSKIEAGKMILEKEPVHVRPVFEDIAQIFTFKINEKGLAMHLQIEDAVPEFLVLDEARLRQVMLNLVGNAIKFTHSGEVRIHVHSSPVNESTEILDLHIDIRDTGIGIPLEQQEKVFESFEQQSGQRTREYGGTGLGLSISRKLVELMDGDINMESQVGTGSTFSIRLGNVLVGSATGQQIPNVDKDRILRFKPATVLVADDVESIRALVKSTLESRGINVVEAVNGQQALNITRDLKPDAILMDLKMPEMNGVNAAEAINTTPDLASIPVVALTSSRKNSGHEGIFQGYLEKPVTPSILVSELKNHLEYEYQQEDAVEHGKQLPLGDIPQDKLSSVLTGKVLNQWKLAVDSGVFRDAETFAAVIREAGINHQVEQLVSYANAVSSAAESFEAKQLQDLLESFNSLIQQERKE